MTPFTTTLSCLLAIVAGQAPQTRDRDESGAHRLVIVNGARRSVHYFPHSAGDADSYRDLERAENEALLASDLQNLRSQYIRDEQYLQPIRRQIQERLYGGNYTVNTSLSSMGSTFYPNNNISSFTPLSSPVSSSGFPLGGGFQNVPLNTTGLSPRSGTIGTGTMLAPGLGAGTFTPFGATSALPFNVNSMTPFGSGLPVTSSTAASAGTTTGTSIPTNGLPSSTVLPNGSGFFNPFGFGGLGGAGLGSLFGGLGSSALFGGAGSFNPYFSLYGNTQMAQSSQNVSSNFSLANGMGDEGRLKTAMAAVLASQSTVDYQQRVRANLQTARAAVENRHPHVAVTLKDGEKHSGRLVQQSGDWLVIREGEEEHYVRTADIVRMTKRVSDTDRTARLGR